jgi:hypothetical protein
MALCEQGYRCDVCGGDVEEMTDSDLYLRFVLGDVLPENLNISRERHIRCNPTLAQFIIDERFPPVACEGPFAKQHLDPAYVADEEARVTRGWRRLQELPSLGVPITDYPLPEVLEAQHRAAASKPSTPPENRTEFAERMRGWQQAIAQEVPSDPMRPG